MSENFKTQTKPLKRKKAETAPAKAIEEIRDASEPVKPKKKPKKADASAKVADVVVGSFVGGQVTSVTDDGVIVRLSTSQDAIVPNFHLSDFPDLSQSIKARIQNGQELSDLLVLEKPADKPIVLSMKRLFKSAVRSGGAPMSLAAYKPQSVHVGFISGNEQGVVRVGFLNGVVGQRKVKKSSSYPIGQTVRAYIRLVDAEKGLLDVDLDLFECRTADPDLLQAYFDDEEMIGRDGASDRCAVGSCVDATVTKVEPFGVLCSLPNGQTGLAVAAQTLGVECREGQVVRARVLDYNADNNFVDLSLRPDFVKFGEQSHSPALAVGGKAACVVQLVKQRYLVVSLPRCEHVLGFLPTASLNDFKASPHELFTIGQALDAKITRVPSSFTTQSHADSLLLLLETKGAVASDAQPAAESVRLGAEVKCRIVAILNDVMHVVFGANYATAGEVHVTDVRDEPLPSHPFALFSIGQTLPASVIEIIPSSEDLPRGRVLLSTRNRPSAPLRLDTLGEGSEHLAVVTSVGAEGIDLLLSAHLSAHVDIGTLPPQMMNLETLRRHYQPGQSVYIRVLSKKKGRVVVTVVQHSFTVKASGKSKASSVTLVCGRLVRGKINKVSSIQGLIVDLDFGARGRVALTDVSDTFTEAAWSQFKAGKDMEFVALGLLSDGRVRLSLRPSHIRMAQGNFGPVAIEDPEIHHWSQLRAGYRVRGYVTESKGGRLAVQVGYRTSANVWINAPQGVKAEGEGQSTPDASAYPIGTLVCLEIIRLIPNSERHVFARIVDPSSSPSDVGSRGFDALEVGEQVECKVNRTTPDGVHLHIPSTHISGLCTKAELPEDLQSVFQQHFAPGQTIKVRVLGVVPSMRFADFTFRDYPWVQHDYRGLLADELAEDPSGVPLHDLQDSPLANRSFVSGGAVKEESEPSEGENSDQEDDSMSEEEDEEEEGSGRASQPAAVEARARAMAAAAARVFEDESEDEAPQAKPASSASQPSLSVGFQWDDFALSKAGGAKAKAEPSDAVYSDEEEEDEEQAAEGDSGKGGKKRVTHRDKVKARRDEERMIEKREQELLDRDRAPQSVEDYERLLVGSPSSSFLWIKYIAFMMSLTELKKARDVAERALKTINISEQREKFNVWVAYLNLENSFGTEQSLANVVQRALSFNEPKLVYLQLLQIYSSAQNEKKCEETIEVMKKKFKMSCKVWLAIGHHQVNNKQQKAAADTMKRALEVLPKRKHVKFLSKFAQFEYKFGSPEHGRALFEGMVANYPKRLDLWNIYIDMEIFNKSFQEARRLFERVVSTKQSLKKSKFLFKKFLDFERRHGNETTVEHVKELARQYIESPH